MRLHQLQQCMYAAVRLLIVGGIERLQQGEVIHRIKGETKVETPFQLIGQREQTHAERFGMGIEVDGDVLYV